MLTTTALHYIHNMYAIQVKSPMEAGTQAQMPNLYRCCCLKNLQPAEILENTTFDRIVWHHCHACV